MSTSRPIELKQEFKTLSILDIEPYWRNPRRITDEAVNAIAESIRRYGYLQPIVVDENYVIIIGHTRYAAMKRLGYTELKVAVERNLAPKQVKQLRTIDNRVGEFSTWDFEKLVEEIDSLSPDALRAFFPEIVGDETLEQVSLDTESVTVELDLSEQSAPDNSNIAEFVCPSCFHGWEQPITEKDVMSGLIGGNR